MKSPPLESFTDSRHPAGRSAPPGWRQALCPWPLEQSRDVFTTTWIWQIRGCPRP